MSTTNQQTHELVNAWLDHAAECWQLSSAALGIGVHLAMNTNPNDHSPRYRASPTQRTLAARTGRAEGSVRKAIKELRDKGIIEVRVPQVARPTSRQYAFLPAALDALAQERRRHAQEDRTPTRLY